MPQLKNPSLPDRLTTLILAVAALAAVVASIVVIRGGDRPMEKLKLATGYALLIFLFFLSMAVLLDIVRNKIDLSDMLEELSGGASMSRFQLLVFTFVIAFSFFVVVASQDRLPEIPTNVLTMLGISASTYAVSKGLQISSGRVGTDADKSGHEEPTDVKTPESKEK
jgi:hypothetical protein